MAVRGPSEQISTFVPELLDTQNTGKTDKFLTRLAHVNTMKMQLSFVISPGSEKSSYKHLRY